MVAKTHRIGRHRIGAPLLALGLTLTSAPAAAQDINTLQIISQTTSAALRCMNWRPVGTCFWLHCSLTGGCSVRTSLKVGHYMPDLVVGAFPQLGQTPWVEVRNTTSAAADTPARSLIQTLSGTRPGGGDAAESRFARHHTTQRFKEGDATGHPTGLLGLPDLDLGAFSVICPTMATAFQPYFHSGLDAFAWRWSIPETTYPQALLPGQREIGQFPAYTWGAVYPRHGFLNQTDDAKTGAVIAQRVGDIVTRANQPHVYTRLASGGTTNRSGYRVWRPSPLRERNARTGTWQMLTPNAESSCSVFGTSDLGTTHSWGVGRTADTEDRSYAWNLWRPYRCCRRRGSYITSITWTSYP
ncbi:MAG: TIGR03756 family integrating conjugative element protein [Ectothiorhodospira sp.]